MFAAKVASMLGDTVGVVIDRNPEFDMIEELVNDPFMRSVILEATNQDGGGFDWQRFARLAGIPQDRLEEVKKDWKNLDEIIVGCVEALDKAGDAKVKVRPGVSHTFCVNVEHEDDAIVLEICRPQETLVVI